MNTNSSLENKRDTVMLEYVSAITGWRMEMGMKDVQPKSNVIVREPQSANNSSVAQSLDRWLLTLFRSQ